MLLLWSDQSKPSWAGFERAQNIMQICSSDLNATFFQHLSPCDGREYLKDNTQKQWQEDQGKNGILHNEKSIHLLTKLVTRDCIDNHLLSLTWARLWFDWHLSHLVRKCFLFVRSLANKPSKLTNLPNVDQRVIGSLERKFSKCPAVSSSCHYVNFVLDDLNILEPKFC